MKKFFKKIFQVQFIFPVILIFISAVLAARNYTPRTFLSGWDTLHPEFNFSHAFSSVFWGGWRNDQGLGAIAAHSHMAEIPRLIFLFLSSIVLPLSFLRYFYFFVCLILGPLGLYFFVNFALKEKSEKLSSQAAAFSGALYFLLNLATLQHFYVPFEMFATHFAFLPWIFYLTLKFLKQGGKKPLLGLALVSFLAAPQAYAATLFYAFLLCFISFLVVFSLISKPKKQIGKRAILIVATVILTNLFWIFPNAYSVFNQSSEIEQSQINTLFSPEAALHNQQWGTLDNIILNKNFLFDWREYSYTQGKFVQVLNEWNDYLAKPEVLILGWVIAAMAVIGGIWALVKRDKIALSLVPALLFCLFFLINQNPPTGFLYNFLLDNFPILEEAIRTPFTKFSIFLMLIMSYFFAYLIFSIVSQLFKLKKTIVVPILISILSLTMLVAYMLPAFRGNLISKSMRVNIPVEYFDMFDWFKTQPNQRIATLPMYTMWGWKYFTWGYQGAGFNWFGLNQPVLERDFDRWNADNETFYEEASNAIYEQNQEDFENILAKYRVGYLMLDDSEFNPGGDQALLKTDLLKSWLDNSPNIVEKKEFGFITVYKTVWGEDQLFAPSGYQFINRDSTYNSHDRLNYADTAYITSNSGKIFPLANLDKRQIKPELFEDKIVLRKSLNLDGQYQLNIPDLVVEQKEVLVSVSGEFVDGNYKVVLTLRPPTIIVDDNTVPLDPVTYEYNFRVNGDEIGYVSVGNHVYQIDASQSGPVTLGTQTVSTSSETPISVYAPELIVQEEFFNELKAADASWCRDSTQVVPTEVDENGLTINVGKESICIGNSVILPVNGLNSLGVISSGQMYPFVCLNSATSDGCINSSRPFEYQNQEGYSRDSLFLTPLDKGNYWQAFVAQGQDEGEKSLTLNFVGDGYYPEVSRINANLGESFGVFYSSRDYTFDSPKEIVVELPLIISASEDFGLNRGYPQTKNCDLDELGEVDRVRMQGSVEYFAINDGISCDYFDYPSLGYGQGYYMRFAGENKEGRSIKVYLQNQGENRIQDEVLIDEGNFDTLTYLSPVDIAKSGGYVANIENRSFGRLAATNLIETLEFIPVPSDWLANIDFQSVDNFNGEAQLNQTQVDTTSNTGLIYRAQVKSTGKEGLVVFPQSYQSGWRSFPKLPHVEVNSWANGWLLPEGEENIVIFYMPQLLQFIGGILGVLWLILILLVPRRIDKKHIL